MVQGVDGNWYGYFADRNMALIADSTSITSAAGFLPEGLNFGTFCGTDATVDGGASLGTVKFSDTVGFAIPVAGGLEGNAVLALDPPVIPDTTCGDLGAGVYPIDPLTALENNVVREAKDMSSDLNGQIDIGPGFWPLIQLYPLNPTGNVIVQYNKGGGVQTTTLTFDTVDEFAGAELDRAIYTTGAQVHATITDLWLNIDPTDADSWTFATVGDGSSDPSTHYQVFDENGGNAGDTVTNTDKDLTDVLGDLMCEDNCRMETVVDIQGKGFVISLNDNDDSAITDDTTMDGIDNGADNSTNPLDWSTEGIDTTLITDNNLVGLVPVTITEQGPNSGVFGSYDESDNSSIVITNTASRGTSASIDYNETPISILVGFDFGSVDIQPVDETWSSGEEIAVVVVDNDANKNSRTDEDLDLFNANVDLIPSLETGDPFTLGESDRPNDSGDIEIGYNTGVIGLDVSDVETSLGTVNVQEFSFRALPNTSNDVSDVGTVIIDLQTTMGELKETITNPTSEDFSGFNLFNLDVRGLISNDVDVYLIGSGSNTVQIMDGTTVTAPDHIQIVDAVDNQSLTLLNSFTGGVFDNETVDGDNLDLLYDGKTIEDDEFIGIAIVPQTSNGQNTQITIEAGEVGIVADFFSFGYEGDGVVAGERIANQIIRIEAEETSDNSGTFEGSLEYIMVNQLNILNAATYSGLSTIADDPSFIVIEDLTDEDAPRVNYFDLGADGVSTQVADQEEAPSHSGVVSFDSNSYKIADTVVITLDDQDLNVDSDLIDIYTVVNNDGDNAHDAVGDDELPTGLAFGDLGVLLNVTFDDEIWTNNNVAGCTTALNNGLIDNGLGDTGFTLVETDTESGVFTGDFQIPTQWCRDGSNTPETSTGLDLEVNYIDFRDASGEIIEVGSSAGVRANTGSISLDRTVYPVPFGVPENFGNSINENNPDGNSVFAVHATGVSNNSGNSDGDNSNDIDDDGSFIANGDLLIHVRVNDPDFDISASGEDQIAQTIVGDDGEDVGLVKISVIRGSDVVILGYAGDEVANDDGLIHVGDDDKETTRSFGPIEEIAPDAGNINRT
jgi:hypothetical protein